MRSRQFKKKISSITGDSNIFLYASKCLRVWYILSQQVAELKGSLQLIKEKLDILEV